MGKRLTRSEQMEAAEAMINIFEEFLFERNINIKNDEKNDPDICGECSNIYGTDYANMESDVLDKLKRLGLISRVEKKETKK